MDELVLGRILGLLRANGINGRLDGLPSFVSSWQRQLAVIMDVGHKSLRVFQLSYKLAMEIFEISKTFPREECYSLTDQIRRSSRSVAANIAEGYRKRQYPNAFSSKMADADGETAETQVWLDVAKDCRYIDVQAHLQLTTQYEEVGSMLGHMIRNPEKFKPRNSLPTASASRQL